MSEYNNDDNGNKDNNKNNNKINQNVLLQIRVSVTATFSFDGAPVDAYDWTSQWLDDSKQYILTVDDINDSDDDDDQNPNDFFPLEQPLKFTWEMVNTTSTITNVTSSSLGLMGDATLSMLFPLEPNDPSKPDKISNSARMLLVALWEDGPWPDGDDSQHQHHHHQDAPKLLARRLANLPKKVLEFKTRESKLVPVELHANGPFVKVDVEAITMIPSPDSVLQDHRSTFFENHPSKPSRTPVWLWIFYSCTAAGSWLCCLFYNRKEFLSAKANQEATANGAPIDNTSTGHQYHNEEEEYLHALAEKDQLSYEAESSSSDGEVSVYKIYRPPKVVRDSPHHPLVPQDLEFLSRNKNTQVSQSKRAIWKVHQDPSNYEAATLPSEIIVPSSISNKSPDEVLNQQKQFTMANYSGDVHANVEWGGAKAEKVIQTAVHPPVASMSDETIQPKMVTSEAAGAMTTSTIAITNDLAHLPFKVLACSYRRDMPANQTNMSADILVSNATVSSSTSTLAVDKATPNNTTLSAPNHYDSPQFFEHAEGTTRSTTKAVDPNNVPSVKPRALLKSSSDPEQEGSARQSISATLLPSPQFKGCVVRSTQNQTKPQRRKNKEELIESDPTSSSSSSSSLPIATFNQNTTNGDSNWLRRRSRKKRGNTHLHQPTTTPQSGREKVEPSSPTSFASRRARQYEDHEESEDDFAFPDSSTSSSKKRLQSRVTPSTAGSRKRRSCSQSDTITTVDSSHAHAVESKIARAKKKRRKRKSLAKANLLSLPNIQPSKQLESAAERVMGTGWNVSRRKSKSRVKKKLADT